MDDFGPLQESPHRRFGGGRSQKRADSVQTPDLHRFGPAVGVMIALRANR